MKIVRKYRKDSKHKWWRIILVPKYRSTSGGYKSHLTELHFEAYGFSSKRDYSDSINVHKYEYNFSCVGRTKSEVISKESKLVEHFYNYIENQREENNKWLKRIKQEYKRKVNLYDSHEVIKDFRKIDRKQKLEKINKWQQN